MRYKKQISNYNTKKKYPRRTSRKEITSAFAATAANKKLI